MMDPCPICKELLAVDDDDIVCLKQKGADGINSWAEKKGDILRVVAGVKVHKSCRKNYTRDTPSNLPQSNGSENRHSTRSSTGGFDFRRNCFLCGRVPTERESRMMFIMLHVN